MSFLVARRHSFASPSRMIFLSITVSYKLFFIYFIGALTVLPAILDRSRSCEQLIGGRHCLLTISYTTRYRATNKQSKVTPCKPTRANIS
jgi:hypothetical protein